MRARLPVSLDVIRVENPCPADWDAMHGDDRVRFCDECKLHVYNLSSLTRGQAEKLVAQHEGRLCVRYFARADGTVITQDCGGGLRRVMQRTRRLVTMAAGAMLCAILSPFGFGSNVPRGDRTEARDGVAVAGAALTGQPSAPREVRGEAVMGDVAPRLMMGGACAPPPLMGKIAPATRPATQPTTNPSE
jgi:hypothetical protein